MNYYSFYLGIMIGILGTWIVVFTIAIKNLIKGKQKITGEKQEGEE